MRKKFIVVLVAALSGCSLVEPFQKPEPPVAENWPSVGLKRADAVQTDMASLPWREAYPDPQLQALIAMAIANNHDLRISATRIAEARANYGITRSGRLPTLNAVASNSTSRVPAGVFGSGGSSSAFISRRNDLNVSMPSSELDFWNRIGSLADAAKATYLATEAAHEAFRVSLVASVADAWLAEIDANERLMLANATVASREQSLDLVSKRHGAGLASELDVATAEAALAATRADSSALVQQRDQAHNYLVALVGKTELPGLAGAPLAERQVVGELEPGLPSEVLTRRPDVRAAEERLRAAHADIGAARAAFFPRITLTGAFGVASRQLSGLFDAGSDAWSFSPVLTLPIFDAGRNRANLDIAKAREVAAVADYEKTVQQAFREVADALAARAALAGQIEARTAQLDAAQRRLRLADARWRQGVTSYLDVLDAQRDLNSAEQGVVAARRADLSARVHLYAALGGGAVPDPADADYPTDRRNASDDQAAR